MQDYKDHERSKLKGYGKGVLFFCAFERSTRVVSRWICQCVCVKKKYKKKKKMKMWWCQWSAATMVSVLLKVAAVYSQVEISDLDKPSELCSGFPIRSFETSRTLLASHPIRRVCTLFCRCIWHGKVPSPYFLFVSLSFYHLSTPHAPTTPVFSRQPIILPLQFLCLKAYSQWDAENLISG